MRRSPERRTMGDMRICRECELLKPLTDFHKHAGNFMDRDYICATCANPLQRLSHAISRREKPEVAHARDKRCDDNKRLRPEDLKKIKARMEARNAIRYGKLEVAKVCQMCDSHDSLQLHHADYGKPLEVVVLCANCHRNHHKEEYLKEQNI